MQQPEVTAKEQEMKTIFTSSCIESAARASGCSAAEMYQRMKKVNMIADYIWEFYDVLHTQSRAYVTEDVLKTLEIWERKAGITSSERKEVVC